LIASSFTSFCFHKASRLKLKASRIIGNTAQKFPDKVKDAVPELLKIQTTKAPL